MARRGPRTGATALGALALAVAVTACSSPAPVAPSSGAAAAPTTTPSSPPPSPTPTVVSDASPFSGLPGGLGRPVLVVKYDNTRFAQPHTGLRSADLVYVEEVEWGLTRLAAVFATTQPKAVGPVRSARISDIELLAQFGAPAFAYSGSQHRLQPVLAAAPLLDVSQDQGPRGWYRDPRRRAPYNLFGRPAALLAPAPGASGAADIGFVFSSAVPAGGRAVRTAVVPYPDSQARFDWNAKAGLFDVWLNGRKARAAEGGIQHAATVVLQYVRQSDSGYGDRYGGRTPLLRTVGAGTGWVLRDGRGYPVTWSRPTATAGTQFVGADGEVVAFKPGQVWVVLVNSRTKAVLS